MEPDTYTLILNISVDHWAAWAMVVGLWLLLIASWVLAWLRWKLYRLKRWAADLERLGE